MNKNQINPKKKILLETQTLSAAIERSRTYKLWLVIGCLVTVLAACSPVEKERPDSTITIQIDSVQLGPQYWAPYKFLLFDTLVSYNPFDPHGEIKPRLAQSWEHSTDYREWTYHLRSDVRWNDGIPFTSRDVKFTVELFAQPNILYFRDLENVSAPDETTVIIRTRNPPPIWRRNLSIEGFFS